MASSRALKPADSKNYLAPRSPGRAEPSTPAQPWSGQPGERALEQETAQPTPGPPLDEAGVQRPQRRALRPPRGATAEARHHAVERADQHQRVGSVQ